MASPTKKDITFSAANTVGLNNPGTEIITLVKDGSGNFINPPSYDKMRAYLRSGEVPMLFVTDEAGESGSLYQLDEYSETGNKIRFSNSANAVEFCAGCEVPNVYETVPKPLTYDYMPEGYPTKAMGTVTVMEEQELAFASQGDTGQYSARLKNGPEIAEGKTYTVNWDGAAYECVCVAFNSFLTLGNRSIGSTGDDTGEPFVYAYDMRTNHGTFVTLDPSASHTISVTTTEEITTPIAKEFLPATALITYDVSTDTYSSDFTNEELSARLLDGKHIVLYKIDGNEYLYLTKWAKVSSGRIDLAFAGEDYSISLLTDGTIGKKPLS